MHILFTRFPLESAYGGAEVQTLALMRGLKDRGHEVSFLGSCPTILAQCEKNQIENFTLKIGNPPVSKLDAFVFLWRKRRMERMLETSFDGFSKIDVIFMLSLSEKILLTPHAIERGMKVIWVEHDTVGRWLTKNPWLPRLTNLSASVTTVCVSQLSAEIYRKLDWKNVVAIPNGVMEQKIQKPKNGNQGLIIGCIARLAPEKGVDLLIEAIRELPDFQLRILGHGREAVFLEPLLEKPRMQLQISIEDTNDFYQSINILVLPSCKHDPFGLVVAEAMARGIPTICTDACGIASYLQNMHDALIVPAGSRDALRKAFVKLRDPTLRRRIGEEGKTTALKKFSQKSMINAYEHLLSV